MSNVYLLAKPDFNFEEYMTKSLTSIKGSITNSFRRSIVEGTHNFSLPDMIFSWTASLKNH